MSARSVAGLAPRYQEILEVVNGVIPRHGRSRDKLINILQDIQGKLKYLPREALALVSRELGIPLSEIIAVASFYHQFRLEPVGEYVLQVCFGTACYLRGSGEIYESLKLATRSMPITVEKARCFGCCSLAPVVMAVSTSTGEKEIHGRLTPAETRKLVYRYASRIREKGGKNVQ